MASIKIYSRHDAISARPNLLHSTISSEFKYLLVTLVLMRAVDDLEIILNPQLDFILEIERDVPFHGDDVNFDNKPLFQTAVESSDLEAEYLNLNTNFECRFDKVSNNLFISSD
jgi:hypothetical protein